MATSTYSRTLLREARKRVALTLRLTQQQQRWQSKLTSNKCNTEIYVHPDKRGLSSHILSLLPTEPANPDLALGSTSEVPPTVSSFQTNPRFLQILQSVLAAHAHEDPFVAGSAQAFASTAGAALGSATGAGSDGGAGGASAQGGMGGAGRGGYIHVWDSRKPPDFGRIPDPEDIFGSLEVDGNGNFVDGHGRYQESGTYRLLTPDGILGVSDFIRGKLVERLRQEEGKAQ